MINTTLLSMLLLCGDGFKNEPPPKEKELLSNHEVSFGAATYKPGKGLSLKSKDERFELITRLRAQFLYTAAHESETLHDFGIRRARLQFKGHFWNKHNKFKTEFAFSPRDMGFKDGTVHRTPILDWYLEFDYLRDFTLRVGQYKVPYSRQRVVSSGNLQLVDRSIVNKEFNLDRDIGFDFRSKDFLGLDRLRYYAGVYMGEGRDNDQLTNGELMYIGRIEYLPLGLFTDYKEGDFERGKPRLSLGLAYSFVDGAQKDRGILGSTFEDEGKVDYHNVNGDLVFKYNGFSWSNEAFYRYGDKNDARNGVGATSQVGMFFVPRVPVEAAGRYSHIVGTGETALGERQEAGGGLSYYIAGHPMKVQADYFKIWENHDVNQDEHMFRLQLQASF